MLAVNRRCGVRVFFGCPGGLVMPVGWSRFLKLWFLASGDVDLQLPRSMQREATVEEVKRHLMQAGLLCTRGALLGDLGICHCDAEAVAEIVRVVIYVAREFFADCSQQHHLLEERCRPVERNDCVDAVCRKLEAALGGGGNDSRADGDADSRVASSSNTASPAIL